jgi:transcriptional regulator with XRE-family HTH domain
MKEKNKYRNMQDQDWFNEKRIPESPYHDGTTTCQPTNTDKEVSLYPPRPEGYREARPHYEKYWEGARENFWCDYHECWVCEKRCESRKKHPELWFGCAFCEDGVINVKAAREFAELTRAEISQKTGIPGKELIDYEGFPTMLIPPEPRFNAEGKVKNREERNGVFRLLQKILRACAPIWWAQPALIRRDSLQDALEEYISKKLKHKKSAEKQEQETNPTPKRKRKRRRTKVRNDRGAVLREHLRSHGMTQAELAREVGISRQAINKMANGQIPISPDVAEHTGLEN